MIDLVLAIAHHLAVSMLVGLLAAEIAMLRPGISASGLGQLGRVDRVYGMTAGTVLVVGFSRVFFGAHGSDFYFSNPVFWAKIGAFVLVGLLSVPPTDRHRRLAQGGQGRGRFHAPAPRHCRGAPLPFRPGGRARIHPGLCRGDGAWLWALSIVRTGRIGFYGLTLAA